MTKFLSAAVVAALACGPGGPARADADDDAKAILDQAIQALGGEEKLGTVQAATWKARGAIRIGGNDSPFTMQTTVQGLDRFRQEFEVDFGGNKVKNVTVLNGDSGWRKLGANALAPEPDAVANLKRIAYLQMTPTTLLPLRGKGFEVRAAGEEKVGGRPAAILEVTGPDGQDFKLFFDKESGLPVKQVAKVPVGGKVTQETTYGSYKDFGGIKRATKIEAKRDGEKVLEQEITEFKLLEKVDPKTFAKPE